MKRFIVVLTLTVLCSIVEAQNVINLSIPNELKEEYVANLFKECKIIYCDFDTLENDICIKKMEVQFFDTTFFFSAYLSSSSFATCSYASNTYECTYVQMDDGGYGLQLDNISLDDTPYLKHVVNELIRKTPRVEIRGDCIEDTD